MTRIKIDVIDMKILDILQEIHHVTGDDCFLLKVREKDSPHFNSFLHNVILKTEGVTDKRSINCNGYQ